jgi:hypothetical protein
METQSKIRKKLFTVVEQACHEIRGFRNLYEQLDDKVRLSGQSLSTLKNYVRKQALGYICCYAKHILVFDLYS